MRWWVRKLVGGVVLFVVAVAALSLVTQLLWNALVPSLFHGPSVTLLQAAGLLLLSHLLLRGGPWRPGHGWRHERWQKRWEEKLGAMTPEERERLRQEWRHRCGWGAPDAPAEHKPTSS